MKEEEIKKKIKTKFWQVETTKSKKATLVLQIHALYIHWPNWACEFRPWIYKEISHPMWEGPLPSPKYLRTSKEVAKFKEHHTKSNERFQSLHGSGKNIKKWFTSASAEEEISKKETKFEQQKIVKNKETSELQYTNPCRPLTKLKCES